MRNREQSRLVIGAGFLILLRPLPCPIDLMIVGILLPVTAKLAGVSKLDATNPSASVTVNEPPGDAAATSANQPATIVKNPASRNEVAIDVKVLSDFHACGVILPSFMPLP